MAELWFECLEYYIYIQMWQYMLICGVGAKPLTHLMQHHLLQWEVAKVKPLMNSNTTLTVLNHHQKTSKGATTKIQVKRYERYKTTAVVCISRRTLQGKKYLFRDIHNFSFSTKIQDGHQKWRKLKFSHLE